LCSGGHAIEVRERKSSQDRGPRKQRLNRRAYVIPAVVGFVLFLPFIFLLTCLLPPSYRDMTVTGISAYAAASDDQVRPSTGFHHVPRQGGECGRRCRGRRVVMMIMMVVVAGGREVMTIIVM
jgi:hypothetical protein